VKGAQCAVSLSKAAGLGTPGGPRVLFPAEALVLLLLTDVSRPVQWPDRVYRRVKLASVTLRLLGAIPPRPCFFLSDAWGSCTNARQLRSKAGCSRLQRHVSLG
jgi:hypothetical protein